MDTKLRITDSSFKLQRAEILKALVQPLAIVELFDERKDIAACLIPPVIRLMVNEFFF